MTWVNAPAEPPPFWRARSRHPPAILILADRRRCHPALMAGLVPANCAAPVVGQMADTRPAMTGGAIG